MQEKKIEHKQYPDIGPGIATGIPQEHVVGNQAVNTGKKPYPPNPNPMQGPGDNQSVQPVIPKLQPWTPDPDQTEEGIDQYRLLTDPDYANLVTGRKLREPMASRVLNEEVDGSWVTPEDNHHIFVTDGMGGVESIGDNRDTESSISDWREAVYLTVPNGLQEETESTLQQMFDKERAEHPSFSNDQIWQIVSDHLDKTFDDNAAIWDRVIKIVGQQGSTIYIDPSFDGDHKDYIRNIGEHFELINQELTAVGFIEKQRIAGVSRYSHPMTGSMAEVKPTDNSGLLHVLFSDRIGQVLADVSTFSGLKDFLKTWYEPKQQYSRSLKPLVPEEFNPYGLLCGMCDKVMHDGTMKLVSNYDIVPIMNGSVDLIVCEECAKKVGRGVTKRSRFGTVFKDLDGKYRPLEK